MKSIKLLLIAPFSKEKNGGISTWTSLIKDKIEKDNDIIFHFLNISSKMRVVDNNRFVRLIYSFFCMIIFSFKLKRIMKNNSIDIIHLCSNGGLGNIRDRRFIKIAKCKKIPIVYHLHFGSAPSLLEKHTMISKMFIKNLQETNYIVTLDKTTQSLVSFYNKNVSTVPNFINNTQNDFDQTKLNYVTFVGWITDSKGIRELLSSWDKISETTTNWKLRLIGPIKRNYLSYLKENYKMPRVEFLGEIDNSNVVKELNYSRIMVLPSYTEGFPMSIIEAMNAKNCVISTDVGACKDILGESSGIIINPRSVDDLIATFNHLFNNESEIDVYALRGYNRVVNCYSSVIVYPLYKEIWNSVILNNENNYLRRGEYER